MCVRLRENDAIELEAGFDSPLYEIKANLFKALSHPARIRILELLVAAEEPVPVSSLLETLGLEASLLSQHLRVLRRHHVVTSTRNGNAVTYQVSHPQIESLLLAARGFLLDHLAVQQRTLAMAAQL